ncbi:helical backbone metal receptor [uncultured Cohaesibacter sp.]|uniref:helical backbone metal receptor n=1 Tax=uncultured Cohaesibacter sp. TaxID=1002546 RepID=UPI002AAAA1EC|nr:helical backbone metal receptor [uncultured Cohaesibacter sp.]
MPTTPKRVISLVPSWTETLLAAGIMPVGRTRFCIHPQKAVADIPVVGGTKDWDWDKLVATKPDLILLDREENARFMGEQTDIPCHVTHVTSLEDMAATFADLARLLSNDKLQQMAERCRTLLSLQKQPWQPETPLPALMEWGRRPEHAPEKILYLIWRKPWMAVSRECFIGDSLSRLGVEIAHFDEKYPAIDLDAFDPETTLLLCASEPYPFHAKKQLLAELPFAHAFVDGEWLSWYGIRSLEFLERELGR